MLNNSGRLLTQGLQIKINKDVVYDNTGENVYRLYEDLWKSSQERDSMVGVGIASLGFRKNLAKSDDASSSSTTNGIKDATLASIMENQRIPLGQILDDHGLHAPRGLGFDVKYQITLPSTSSEIGDAQSSQSVGNFSLENVELEYDTVTNPAIVDNAKDSINSGKSYIIKHISLESTTTWDKASTSVNENLHISRESLKAIVYLFKYTDQNLDEVFIDPGITEVTCNANGKPNVVHTTAMKPDSIEKEARRFFEGSSKEISTGQFFANTYCVVIDFRSLPEHGKYNDGISVKGTSGIQTTFKRTASAKDVKCYTFVVADSIVQLDSSGFQKTIL